MGWAAAQVGGWARHVEKPPGVQRPKRPTQIAVPPFHATQLPTRRVTCSVRNLPVWIWQACARSAPSHAGTGTIASATETATAEKNDVALGVCRRFVAWSCAGFATSEGIVILSPRFQTT